MVLLEILSASVLLISALLIAGLLARRKRYRKVPELIFLIMLVALEPAMYLGQHLGAFQISLTLFLSVQALPFLYAGALRNYVQGLSERREASYRKSLRLSPGLFLVGLAGLMLIPSLAQSFEAAALAHRATTLGLLALLVLAQTFWMGYEIAMSFRLNRKVKEPALRCWIRQMAGISALVALGYFVTLFLFATTALDSENFWLFEMTLMAPIIALLTLTYLLIHHSPWPALAPSAKAVSAGPGLEYQHHYNALQAYMAEHKPYLAHDMRIPGLAEAVQLPPHLLSKVINQEAGQSFSDYVNRHRIEEFKRLVKAGKHHELSIAGLAHEVGFQSRSSFYAAFGQAMGTTPSAYIKSQEKEG